MYLLHSTTMWGPRVAVVTHRDYMGVACKIAIKKIELNKIKNDTLTHGDTRRRFNCEFFRNLRHFATILQKKDRILLQEFTYVYLAPGHVFINFTRLFRKLILSIKWFRRCE